MDSRLLNQEEIDALLNGGKEPKALTEQEKDALGEIANISMDSAATALSELLNTKVIITNPSITVCRLKELVSRLPEPHIAIEVGFVEGLLGANLLIMSNSDAIVLAQMMMGEKPTPQQEPLDEIQTSAASEAMNQMIASAATAMSQVFNTLINISPPKLRFLDGEDIADEEYVLVKFRLIVGDFIDSELIQLLSIITAKEQIRLLFEVTKVNQSSTTQETVKAPEIPKMEVVEPRRETVRVPYEEERNIDLILDIPLGVSVVLGKTKKSIKEILQYQSGSIIEVNRLVEEHVDVLVNGTLVAKGEVVVINDNFGVRITNILSPQERILQLRKGAI